MPEGISAPQTSNIELHLTKSSSRELDGQLVVKGVKHADVMHGEPINPETPHEKMITVEMPREMSERLTAFFDRFLIDPDPSEWVNCHRFAVWMKTGELLENPEYPHGSAGGDHPEVTKAVEEGTRTNGPLEAGQHAVVAQRASTAGDPILPAEHSIIGLGPDLDEALQCIQINDMNGDLTVSSATHYMDRKMRLGIGGKRDLYAAPPAGV